MAGQPTQRALLRQLADRLIVEYAGAVPPGQVLAAVLRANHVLDRNDGITGESRLQFCESLVRHVLTCRIATNERGPVPGAPGWSETSALAS